MKPTIPGIREATVKDVTAMFEIRVSVNENSATRSGLYASGIDEEAVAAAITTEGHGWISEDDGNAVGFSIADQRDGSIFALFVRPEFEGRGHGGRLLDAAVHWLSNRGFERLWLAVGPSTGVSGRHFLNGSNGSLPKNECRKLLILKEETGIEPAKSSLGITGATEHIESLRQWWPFRVHRESLNQRIDTLIAAELRQKNIRRKLAFSGAKTQTISHAP